MSGALPAYMVFSATTLGFYNPDLQAIYGANWPGDGVEISIDAWQTYVSSPPAGQMLGTAGGLPVWIPAPVAAAPTTWTVPLPVIRERVAALGLLPQLLTALVANPAAMTDLVLSGGQVSNTDPTARALITSAGADPNTILAVVTYTIPTA